MHELSTTPHAYLKFKRSKTYSEQLPGLISLPAGTTYPLVVTNTLSVAITLPVGTTYLPVGTNKYKYS